MRKLAVILLGLAAVPALTAADSGVVAIRAARLLDVKSGRYVEHPAVVVRGDRIESVGTSVPSPLTPNA